MTYLSIVMCGSNAGYGGNFLERMQNSVDRLFLCARKARLDAEFILVEWGNPEENLSLSDAIDWARVSIPSKIIKVPKSFVDTIPNPHNDSFLEKWAKNVGIRRSVGEFVLCTNADSMYSSELVHRLARHDLDGDCFYRVDRHDFVGDEPTSVHRANGSTGKRLDRYEDGVPIFRQYEPPHTPSPNALFDYPGIGRIPLLHFNAAGEFTLMSKKAWENIHGYPELPFSCSVDSMAVYLAAKHGYKQVVLPEPLFHADHPRTGRYQPRWLDQEPWAPKNFGDNWGFKGMEFAEEELRMHPGGISPGDLWNEQNGDNTKLIDYPLTPDSVVFDVGAYHGGWSAKLAGNPYIHAFEPVKDFYYACQERFRLNPKIKVWNFGLSDRRERLNMHISGTGSSLQQIRNSQKVEEVEIFDILDFLSEHQITKIDLISINIEGEEYRLLPRMIETGLVSICENIQIQFHKLGPKTVKQRDEIRSLLSLTHNESYNYEFAWESWRKK